MNGALIVGLTIGVRESNRVMVMAIPKSVFLKKVKIMKVREKLIRAGVRNLKEFGYSNVNPDNILTDTVFAAFFKSMLEDNLGNGDEADRIIHGLIAEIDKV
ncbi:MAG: hypothetical protein ACP5EO_10310 [Acidithiobacillus sp.]